MDSKKTSPVKAMEPMMEGAVQQDAYRKPTPSDNPSLVLHADVDKASCTFDELVSLSASPPDRTASSLSYSSSIDNYDCISVASPLSTSFSSVSSMSPPPSVANLKGGADADGGHLDAVDAENMEAKEASGSAKNEDSMEQFNFDHSEDQGAHGGALDLDQLTTEMMELRDFFRGEQEGMELESFYKIQRNVLHLTRMVKPDSVVDDLADQFRDFNCFRETFLSTSSRTNDAMQQ